MTEMSNLSHDALLDHMQACEDLLNASSLGRLRDVEKALNKGANPNFLRTDQGALMIATRRNYPDIVARLIEAGADINQSMRNGWTPLLEASRQNLPEILDVFVKNGANVDQWDGEGMTALYVAVRAKSEEAALYLITKKAALDISTFTGTTPLMEAVFKEQDGIAKILIGAGANVLMQDSDKKTALDHARAASWKDGISILEGAERLAKKIQSAPPVEVVSSEVVVEEVSSVSTSIKKRKGLSS